MQRKPGAFVDWILPLAFTAVTGYVTWHFPRYLVWAGGAPETLTNRFEPAGGLDLLLLLLMPVLFVAGAATLRLTRMEHTGVAGLDRVSLFIGRVTMMLVALVVVVMVYEVMLRYVAERPTLWANELSLWMAGFVFLLSGLYAMQQRCHIRIYILYDRMPRTMQKACDVLSTILIVLFAAAIFWGGYKEASDKLLRWETFGTAFDPPIPATLKPLILVIIALVALQAVSNLILDWNKPAEAHTPADDLDRVEPPVVKGI